MTRPVNKVPGVPRPFGVGQRPFDIDLVRSLYTELGDHARAINDLLKNLAYEEGTWTPAAAFATPGDTANTGHILGSPEGYYLRIGKVVFYSFNWSVGGFTFTPGVASGHLQVTGFPFTFDPDVDFQMGVLSYEGILSDGGAQKQCNTFVRGAQVGFRFSITGVDGFVNEVVADAPHVFSGGNLVLLGSGFVRIVPP